MSNITVEEGMTARYLLTATNANGAPLNLTGSTVEVIVKTASAAVTPSLTFELVVNGSGVGTSTPVGRMALGRPDPANYDGPLIDDTASSGYVTIEFFPEDTEALVASSTATLVWQARQVLGNGRRFPLDRGTFTVTDSYFDE